MLFREQVFYQMWFWYASSLKKRFDAIETHILFIILFAYFLRKIWLPFLR